MYKRKIESQKSSEQLPVKVITPSTGVRSFIVEFKNIISDFPQALELGWRLFLRDLRSMYRQSVLGYVWLALPPLATVFVWVFLNNQNLVNIETGEVPYPLFVLTGTVLWTAFNSSVMAMQGIVGEARGILSKVNFPHEALIIAAFGKTLLNSMVPALVLIPALFIYKVSFEVSMLLFPFGFITLIMLGSAFGLIFVPIGALYGDVGRGIQLALRFGFFVTPVIYAIPESGLSSKLLLLNPVTAPLVTSRSWLVGGESPFVMEMISICMVSLLLLGLATIIFKVVMPHLIERLNS